MSFRNEFTLNVDVKRRMTSIIPTFKQGDAATLKFRIFDDGKEFDLTDFTRAEMTFRLPSGQTIIGEPYLDENSHMIVYKFVGVEMSEVGKLETILSVYSGTSMVSIQPFSVWIFDHLKDKDLSYIGILQDLIAEVELLKKDVNNALTEANQVKDDLTELLKESDEAETIRNTNEQQRIANENVRKSNETDRKTSEDTRKSNETTRIQNEQTRNANEQIRQQSLTDMNTIINQYKFTGTYKTNVTYKKFNQVEFEGSTYIALVDNTNVPVSDTNTWRIFAQKGLKGDKGETGAALSILGKLTSESQLPPTGHAGDAYTVNGELYVWSEVTGMWENVGNIKGEKGDTGVTGEDGQSAYEVAVDNGFVGTSEEWLASLKGEKGDAGKDADLTEINQKVDGIQTEVTEHLAEIASPTKLGHFKPDGVTIIVDPLTGVASVLASGEVNQLNVIKDSSSNALGTGTVAWNLSYLARVTDVNDANKTVTIDNGTAMGTIAVGDVISFHHVYDNVIGTGVISAINGSTLTLTTEVTIVAQIQLISKFTPDYTAIRSSFSSGISSFATGLASTAMGIRARATGSTSLAMGLDAIASGDSSLAIGSNSRASGSASLAIINSTASGNYSISIGEGSVSTAKGAISLGETNKAIGENSVALGLGNTARAMFSHAQNRYTDAGNYGGTAIGLRNKPMSGNLTSFSTTSDAFVIGNQSSVLSPGSNAFRVTFDGKTYGLSSFNSAGADYAEYFEWLDGNPREQDRVGYVVTLDKGKIRKATSKDSYILGVISATPSVIGDSCQDDWNNKYVTDEWGRVQFHWIDVEYEEDVEVVNEDGSIGIEKVPKTRKDYVQKLNPNWNPDQEYTPREERAEWDAVGLVGKLLVRDDGTLFPNNFAKVGALDGELTLSENPTNIRVMERVTSNIVRVFIK